YLRGAANDLLAEVYGIFQGFRQGEAVAALEAKETELRGMVDGFRGLTTPLAKRMANEKMAALETEINDLRGRKESLVGRLDSLYTEVARVKARLQAARQSLAGADAARKAELLSRLVGKIVCHFRHQEGGGRRPSSVLERVEIEPVPAEGRAEDEALFTKPWV